MRTVTITLADTEYEVAELKSRQNRVWREKLEGHFQELADVLEDAPEMELSDSQSLAKLVRTVGGKLLKSVDLITELVISYDPRLEQSLDEAYDSEILDAFTSILGLAYPFGSTIQRLAAQIGSLSNQT
jgi:hypothetical protein